AVSGWNGTTEIAGVSAAWSVTGNLGNITPGGVFTATTTGTGSVVASVTYSGRSASCSSSVGVTAGPPPTVAISSPSSGSNVTTTAGPTVQIRFDGGFWVNASTIGSTWSYRIDTTTTFDGDHLIEAQAVWGSTASPVVARNVVVSNSEPPWLALPQPPFGGLAV